MEFHITVNAFEGALDKNMPRLERRKPTRGYEPRRYTPYPL